MKKFLSLMLAMLMLFSVSITALADVSEYNDTLPTDVLEESPMSRYTDIDNTHEAYVEFKYLVGNDAVTGLGPDELCPDAEMTRAEFVSILRKLVTGINGGGISESPYFEDVSIQSWYVADVEWARNYGVVVGVGNGRFAPDDKITVEQMVTMVYNYAVNNNVALKQVEPVDDSINDMSSVSRWAYEAVSWANMLNLLDKTDGMLNPQRVGTRTDMAKLLCWFDVLVID